MDLLINRSIFISMGRYAYKNSLVVLGDWALKEGFSDVDLTFVGISQVDWKKNTLNTPKDIKIEGNVSYEIQTYILLHELGHHQLRKNWTKFHKELPASAIAEEKDYYYKNKKLKRRLTYAVSCMEEEFKAWEEGLILGYKLDIRINMEKWTDLKTKCLLTYMRYYSVRK